MNNKAVSLKVLGIAILAVLIIFLVYDRTQVGNKIDSYKGVEVYYNGVIFTNTYGRHFSSDGYYYGRKWQCVEYIKRFYYDAKKHKMPDVYGNAKDFFSEKVPQGHLNKARGLIQYRNGGDVPPQVGDLMVFTDTHYGHVAIITQVTDRSVEIIQQNIIWGTRDILPLQVKGHKYEVGDDRKPAGWLRKE